MKYFSVTLLILSLGLSVYGRVEKNDIKEQERKEELKKTLPNRTNYVSPLRKKFEQARAQAKPQMKGKFKPSDFEAVPLNSPVKGSIAKFLLKIPQDQNITQVKYRVKNASHLVLKENDYALTKLIETPAGKELHIPLESTIPGFYRLYIKIKFKKAANEEHQYRSAYHDYVRFVVTEKATGVPMPDRAENRATIAGIDSDQNGIRDDIQIWINEEFKDQPTVKLAMEQLARSTQSELLNSHYEEASKESTLKAFDSADCLESIVSADQSYIYQKRLKEKLLDTKLRLDADIKVNANFSGSKYSLPVELEKQKSKCEFPN